MTDRTFHSTCTTADSLAVDNVNQTVVPAHRLLMINTRQIGRRAVFILQSLVVYTTRDMAVAEELRDATAYTESCC